jgi:hypothetical protein
MTITISDDEKIKIFNEVWAQYETRIEDTLKQQLSQQVSLEMFGTLKPIAKAKILAIADPYMKGKREEIEKKVKGAVDAYFEKLEPVLSKSVISYVEESIIDKILDHVEENYSNFRRSLKNKIAEFRRGEMND